MLLVPKSGPVVSPNGLILGHGICGLQFLGRVMRDRIPEAQAPGFAPQ